MNEYNETKAHQLWVLCSSYVNKHKISCAEDCHDNDRIHETATTLIEDICEIVGYNRDHLKDDDE